MTTVATSAGSTAAALSEYDVQVERFNRRLNDIRTSPLKQLPMTAIMMFMVGNDVSIFSIMFVGMAVIGPIQNMFAVNKVFADFDKEAGHDRGMRSSVRLSKAIYVACCAVAFVVALVKLNWMDLLPVNAVDWMPRTPPQVLERSHGVFVS